MLKCKCAVCGKEFDSIRRDKKYCSKECKSIALSKLRQETSSWNKGIPISEEQKVKFRETVKKTWTEEKREEQSRKQKEVWSDQELRKKHSDIIKAAKNKDRE